MPFNPNTHKYFTQGTANNRRVLMQLGMKKRSRKLHLKINCTKVTEKFKQFKVNFTQAKSKSY